MSDLLTYRAALQRLIEAEDADEAFEKEGISGLTADIVKSSKAFRASRSASSAKKLAGPDKGDRMSQGQGRKIVR